MTRRSDAVDPVALGGATLQWFNDRFKQADPSAAWRHGGLGLAKPFVPENLISTIARAVELTA